MHPSWLQTAETARRVTVFYHASCQDGIAGAWCLFLAMPRSVQAKLRTLGGLFTDGTAGPTVERQVAVGSAIFVGIQPSDEALPAPALVQARHVVYVDVTPPCATVQYTHRLAQTLTIIDHHRSQKPVLDAILELDREDARPHTQVSYAEDLSGAQLAWQWASPTTERPPILEYVGDRDLWKYRQYRSREVCKVLLVENLVRGFDSITTLAGWPADSPMWERLAEKGTAYQAYEQLMIGKITSNAISAVVTIRLPYEASDREYSALVVNTSILQSDVGDALMARAGPETHFAIMWWYVAEKDETWVSIRTNRPDVDLSLISKHIVGAKSGGGHPSAAGCTIMGNRIHEIVRFASKKSL